MKPGDAVNFRLTFTGIVHHVGEKYVDVRTKTGTYHIPLEDVIQVLDPKPPEEDVTAGVRCPRCRRASGKTCLHLQTMQPLKHPHPDRVEAFIKATGWT